METPVAETPPGTTAESQSHGPTVSRDLGRSTEREQDFGSPMERRPRARDGVTDSFARACDRLERLVALRNHDAISESEYDELKNAIVADIKQSVSPSREPEARITALPGTPYYFVPYARLHSDIVSRIEASYRESNDRAKERAFRAMSDMAAGRALNSQDLAALTKLVDSVFATPPATDSQLLGKLVSVTEISSNILSSNEMSPAAKAIAETTEASTIRACQRIPVEMQTGNDKNIQHLWKKLVLPDVEGALNGGAAAVTVFPAIAAALPFTLPIVAALGVIVGAGVRSGVAYGEV